MLLRELYEQDGKTAVVAFGRLNPPTVGHAKLVDKIKSIPGDHFLFLSHTQKPKTDPLDFATKKKFAEQFFLGITIGHEAVKTPVLALEYLQGQGYTDVIFVAGSDRVEGFQKLFDTYNGQPDKTGKIPFKFNSIRVVSAGERDPDADDVSGMSASKMRAAAAAGELQAFAQGVPDKRLAQTMYDAVRRGMGVRESVSEVLDTKAKDAKWTMSSEDMSRLEFTASNGIEYQINFLAPYIGPDEIHPDDFIPNISGEAEDRAVFVEFSQKNATGAAKQGVAGTGAAAEIFGIVTNAILDFAKKRKPPMIYFQAAEVNRRKLYAAIVRRLVSSMSGYTAKQLGDKFAIYSNSLAVKESVTEEILSELFDKPYPYTLDIGSDKATAFISLPDGTKLRVGFLKSKTKWDMSFDRDGTFDAEDQGDQFKVMATVVAVFKEFVEKVKPAKITFDADKDSTNSRVDVYAKLLNRYADKMGYGFTAKNPEGDSIIQYTLTKGKPNVKNTAQQKDVPATKTSTDSPTTPTNFSIKKLAGSMWDEFRIFNLHKAGKLDLVDAIAKLSPEDQEWAKLRWGQGLRIGEIGKKYNLDNTSSLQKYKLIHDKIRQHLGLKEPVTEGYKLQLERDDNMMILNIVDTNTGHRTEVRGKAGYETNGYDPDDRLHQLLDRIGKSANVSELINGEVVTINPKHPKGPNSKKELDRAYNENFADGKNPGRKGLAKRSGVNTKASVSSLRKTAKNSSGEKQRMAHWLANMKAGQAKKK